VKHYVALSVVGTERIPDSPYLRAKSAQETLIKAGEIRFQEWLKQPTVPR